MRPIPFTTEEAIEKLQPIFVQNPKILLLYLFGSRARQEETPESDLDFAFYTSPAFAWKDYYALYREVGQVLHTDRFHLLWLNRSDPIMVFTVLREGKILFFRDVDLLNDFENKGKKNFYDYCVYLRKHRKEQT